MKITKLTTKDIPSIYPVISGYTAHEKYEVSWQDSPEVSYFNLKLATLPTPYVKKFGHEDLSYYTEIIEAGWSLGVFDNEVLVAVALADIQEWNHTFWLHEFHVLKTYQGRGIGRDLMTSLISNARTTSCRTLVCETQNTNVPAIRFYRKMGFKIEAIDVSLYSNKDLINGEIGIFMKHPLDVD